MVVDVLLAAQGVAALVCLVTVVAVAVKCLSCPSKPKPKMVKVEEPPTIVVVCSR